MLIILEEVMEVIVYYCRFINEALSGKFESLIRTLPVEMQHDIRRYKTEKGRNQRLVARLLIAHVIEKNKLDIALSDIEKNRFGRPMIKNGFDFNLSHSGNFVVCAFSKGLKVGIDIELIRDVNLQNFKRIMTEEQWNDIKTNKEPLIRFFHYWTLKESVLKADGKGLRGNMAKVKIHLNDKVLFDDKLWQVKALSIHQDYACHLAYEYHDKADMILKEAVIHL